MKVKEKDLINIDEVCTLAKLSVPTVYRRVKLGQFPKPKKVKSTAARGPKKVNRWERGDVMKWLLKSNDKAPVTKEKAPVTKEIAPPAQKPRPTVLFADRQPPKVEAERHEGPSKTQVYIAQAVVAGLLAGLLWFLIWS